MPKLKGTLVIPVVKYLRRHRDAALALLPESLHHYLEQRIFEAQWYPEEDFVVLLRARVKLTPGPESATWDELGAVGAREHAAGVYRHLMREVDPLALANRIVALWQSQHDTGRWTLRLTGPTTAQLELEDYAHPTVEMCNLVPGYIREVLRSTGFVAPVVVKGTCRIRGQERCSWSCSWESPAAK